MPAKHREESLGAHTVSCVSWGPLRHSEVDHLSARGESFGGQRQNTSAILFISSPCPAVSEDYQHHGFHDTHGEMGTVENETFPERFPPTMMVRQQGPAHLLNTGHKGMPSLVASTEESTQLSFHHPPSHGSQ